MERYWTRYIFTQAISSLLNSPCALKALHERHRGLYTAVTVELAPPSGGWGLRGLLSNRGWLYTSFPKSTLTPAESSPSILSHSLFPLGYSDGRVCISTTSQQCQQTPDPHRRLLGGTNGMTVHRSGNGTSGLHNQTVQLDVNPTARRLHGFHPRHAVRGSHQLQRYAMSTLSVVGSAKQTCSPPNWPRRTRISTSRSRNLSMPLKSLKSCWALGQVERTCLRPDSVRCSRRLRRI